MNERIRKLAEEAGFYFYDMHNIDGEDLGETIEADSWAAADKFAELIVEECSRVIVNGGYRNPAFGERYQLTPPEIATMIKEHFGVE